MMPNIPARWEPDALRRVLVQNAVGIGTVAYFPHHPLSCDETLSLHEDASLECPHGRTKADDPATRAAVNHSIALLIGELATHL